VECAAWRTQPIEGAYAYVYLDGIVLKRSWGGEVRRSDKIGLISGS
jgi:transposase-like protein